ncbi:probable outer membrane protein pmp20 [Dysidea avara]|uniref:probable outer membrane protein pmp20 n=1 Tax=Dysidea avara TaxID=196820 RepID=UPI0033188545
MQTARIVSIFLLCVVFIKAEETINKTYSQEIASGSGTEYDQVASCCVIGEAPFHSIDNAIRNLTNNITIKITESDVVLHTKVIVENLDNIAIIGHGNSTVNCIGIGAINFISCNNVTITGVDWERCGSSNEPSYPGISFYKSSNIIIQSCSFNSSTGQAVVFSEVSGNIHITNSVFTHNKQHGGHGAAVQYSPMIAGYTQTKLVIDSCNFSYNGASKSVIFIGDSGNRELQYSCLQNSWFIGNEGVPVYLSHHKLHIKGDVLFKQNTVIAGGGIFSSSSIVEFKDKSNVIFCNNLANKCGGAISLNDSRIYFGETSLIRFTNNVATSHGGALSSSNNSFVLFGGSTMVTLQSNVAGTSGGALYCENSNVLFAENSTVTFNNNSATFGGAIHSTDFSEVSFDENTSATFTGNDTSDSEGADESNNNSTITFDKTSKVTFSDNKAKYGGAMYSRHYSKILFGGNTSIMFGNNGARYGGALYSRGHSEISCDGNATVIYNGNSASENGGAVYSYVNCNMIFDRNSKVKFSENEAKHGGAVYCRTHSKILFHGNTSVIYKENDGSKSGGAVYLYGNCNITFDGNSMVIFTNNTAAFGGAMYSGSYSEMTFYGNTTVAYNGNNASENGGAVNSYKNGNVTLDGNSKVTFGSNKAKYGGAVFSRLYSEVRFSRISKVTFSDNGAKRGAAVYSYSHCQLSFHGNTSVMYNRNYASENGGAVSSFVNCNITFNGNSKVTFGSNKAKYGGAVFSRLYSEVRFSRISKVTFSDNGAKRGAAVYSYSHCQLSFHGNTSVMYNRNYASENGGAVSSFVNCNVTFNGNSKVTFSDNRANNGGAVYSRDYSQISFNENTSVTYKMNEAIVSGGVVYSHEKCSVLFHDNSTVTFINNSATNGSALYSETYSDVSFDGTSKVTFHENKAVFGGAMFCGSYSEVSFDGNTVEEDRASAHGGAHHTRNVTSAGHSSVKFVNNEAKTGGAMYCKEYSLLLFEDNSKVEFISNIAEDGGAVSLQQSSINFATGSSATFDHNSARRSGGAIHLVDNFIMMFESKSFVIFNQNTATLHGGAIFGELKQTNKSKILSNTTSVEFSSNTALVGDDVYMHIQASCDEMCLNSSMVGLNVTHNNPPRHLALYNPATCITTTNTTNNCNTYFVDNIMLGQNIKINACVLSFHDQPARGVDFVVSGENHDHNLGRTQFVPIACNLFEGVSVTGKETSDITNFTMMITSYTNSDLEISVQLIAELSPCHPGYHYDNTTQKCVCHDDSDIMSCSGSTSTIKRGYWFGVVDGKSTVTVCPKNYCNFTCCETTNGFYQLSPVRMNQCSSHRSGTACGSCEEGYTLSFDSVECVSFGKCTNGQTVLVIVLSVIYWIVLVIAVFIMTYYHVEIGYLYVITYYYSMLEILLGQHLYASQTLYTAVSIMSSIAKVSPQFLGQFCLVKSMIGIDQEFIHYVHPLAVTIIVGIICRSARMSYKLSAFLSRGIIRVICFLLLLSYTSVTTTSLLLLRSLTFHNIAKVYTYLSPDIEYFHGRHLPYVIVAALFTLMIVIGLPLLLLLEPFLNHKINFTRFKPLLDQFQGCYRDKYRSFATYYMICRLVIVSILIINSSNDNTSQVLLLTANILVALIHLIVKPYKAKILNIFDGVVLQIIVFISVISMYDSFGSGVLSAITILFVMLPLIAFATMELIIYKENIKKIVTYCKPKPNTAKDNNIVPLSSDIGIIIDDVMRRNATIVDIQSCDDDATHYRDSFVEVMNEIED